MELQRQLADAHALVEALRGELAASRAAADAHSARADEAWAALLPSSIRQARALRSCWGLLALTPRRANAATAGREPRAD
jgi:hypothetical protein